MTRTRHLSPEDVIDVMEGSGRRELARHAETCDACRMLVEQTQRVAGLAASDEIPDPSPVFWTRFSAHVAASVRRVPQPRGAWAGWMWGWRAIPVTAAIVLIVALGVSRWRDRAFTPPAASERAMASVAHPIVDWDIALPADDEPWALVSLAMAEALAQETPAAAMPTPIGSADRALESLSEGETAELARLLKAELDDPDSSSHEIDPRLLE